MMQKPVQMNGQSSIPDIASRFLAADERRHRLSVEEMKLVAMDERFVPEGTSVAIAGYSLQTSADNFYPEPLEFRPERSLPDAGYKTDKTVPYSFTSGPQMCRGKALAYQELHLVFARLVLALDLELGPGFDPRAFRES
ncbi:cytochrome P450 [Mycena amicta]|nr:cytochrome P450 [Mycena amicta]